MSDDRDLTITEAFNELAAYLVEQSPGDADAGWERLKAAMDADGNPPWQRREPFTLDGATTLTLGVHDSQPGREDVRQWRVHARELDGSTWAVGEWHDGPVPDMGTVAREASAILRCPGGDRES